MDSSHTPVEYKTHPKHNSTSVTIQETQNANNIFSIAHQNQSHGHNNVGYVGSTQNLGNRMRTTSSTYEVYKTQYCCWRSWSKREKIFLLIIVLLTAACMGLTVAISIQNDYEDPIRPSLPWF